MTTAQPDRLDRIERILESVALQQQQTQQHFGEMQLQQQQRTQQHFDEMQLQQQRTQQHFDEMQLQQRQTQQHLDEMQLQQQRTQQQLDELKQIVRESIPNLTEMVGTVLMSLDEFAAELRAIFSSDSASRAAERLTETRMRNEFRQTMLGMQTETRNILRELAELRQQQGGNGNLEG